MDRSMRPNCNAAPAIKDRATQLGHCVFNQNIHRRESRLTPNGLDPIIQLLKRASGATNGDDVMRRGQCKRKSGAKTT